MPNDFEEHRPQSLNDEILARIPSGLTRRGVVLGALGAAALMVAFRQITAERAEAAVTYNLPFTNLAESGTSIPYYNTNFPFGAPYDGGTHHGIDFIGSSVAGRKVYPIRSGVVEQAVTDTSKSTVLGTRVVVRHSNGLRSEYCHLQSRSVSINDTVTPATSIGKIGSTGTAATGSHLHLAVRPSASAANTNPWLLLSGAQYANQVSSASSTHNGDNMALWLKSDTTPTNWYLLEEFSFATFTTHAVATNFGDIFPETSIPIDSAAKIFLQDHALTNRQNLIDSIAAKVVELQSLQP